MYAPKPVIELCHKKTDAPIVGFNEVKEAKASFLHAAASENQTVKAYMYGKEELQHFKPVLEGNGYTIAKIAYKVGKDELDSNIDLNRYNKKIIERNL